MTVMLGGPYSLSSPPSIPSIVDSLSAHLGTSLPEPVAYRMHEHKNAIPTYGLGHVQRMEELEDVLAGEPWDGRLEIIGAGVGGVSLGDCVEAGKRAGDNWRET